jgi:hypothetical protein
VAICSNTFWIPRFAQNADAPADSLLWGVVDHSTTPTPGVTQEPAPRGIGGGVRSEASIEGVRFRCRLQAASRLHSLLTHRNLRHAGQRLKRAFRFRKVLWLLSSKESNNKNKHCTLFASRRGPRRPRIGRPERDGSPARHLLRRRRCIAQGQGSALTANTTEQQHNP